MIQHGMPHCVQHDTLLSPRTCCGVKGRNITPQSPAALRGDTKGFTLIELSIVLVILGLIVGGIVGGRSLMEAARIQSVLREMNGYTTAYNTFKLQYDAIPGDMKDAWDYFGGGIDSASPPAPCGRNNNAFGSGCNGNGNGLIGAHQNFPYHEAPQAFLHLQLADIIHGKVGAFQTSRFSQLSPGTSHPGAIFHYNLPSLPGGSKFDGWILTSHTVPSYTAVTTNWFGKTGNWLQAGGYTGNSHSVLDGAAFTQRQASAIDKKIDDGMPTTGSVSAITGSDNTNAVNTVSPPCMTGGYGDNGVTYADRDIVAQDYPDLTYNVAGNNVSCVLHFYLGN